MGNQKWIRWVAAVLLAGALMAGCGDDDTSPDEDADTAVVSAATSEAAAETPVAETTAAETTAPESAEVSAAETTSATTSVAAEAATGKVTIAIPFESYFAPPIERAGEICAAKGVEIEILPVNAAYLEHNLKLQVQAQSGDAPDLAVQGLLTVGAMGQSDFNPDLAPLIAGNELFDPAALPLLAVGQANGKQVAIPWGVSLPVIWVNVDAFKEAGLDPGVPLATWDDVAAAAAKLTTDDRKGVSFGQAEGWVQLNQLLTGGSNFVNDAGEVIFNDANGQATAAYVAKLFADGLAASGDDAATQQAFLAGRTAMHVTTTTFLGEVAANEKFEWTAMPFPAMGTHPVSLGAGGVGIAMFASEDRQPLATEALGCLFEKPVLESVVTDLGYLSVRPDLKEGLAETLTKPPYAQAETQYDLVGPWYTFPGPNGAQAQQAFLEAWVNATEHSDDPAAVLNDAADSITGIISG